MKDSINQRLAQLCTDAEYAIQFAKRHFAEAMANWPVSRWQDERIRLGFLLVDIRDRDEKLAHAIKSLGDAGFHRLDRETIRSIQTTALNILEGKDEPNNGYH